MKVWIKTYQHSRLQKLTIHLFRFSLQMWRNAKNEEENKRQEMTTSINWTHSGLSKKKKKRIVQCTCAGDCGLNYSWKVQTEDSILSLKPSKSNISTMRLRLDVSGAGLTFQTTSSCLSSSGNTQCVWKKFCCFNLQSHSSQSLPVVW